jgi:hypothetical protein
LTMEACYTDRRISKNKDWISADTSTVKKQDSP